MNQLRSELLKLRTTRTVALLLLAAAGVTLLGACLEGLPPSLDELAREGTQRTVFSAATGGVFFATFAGLISVTGEYRYGTIRPTLLFEPRRRVVLAAKLAVSALAGMLFAVVGVGVSMGAGLAILAVRDVDVVPSSAQLLGAGLGTVATGAFSAMLGAAVGTLIRNQAGAILTLAAYAFAVDATIFAAVPEVGRYLPGKAGDALAGLPDDLLLRPGTGAAVIAAWTLVFVATASVRNDRSDV